MTDKRGTGGQPWPLKSTSNGGENPSFALPGGSTQFEFQDVPDRCPTGPLAYYLLGVMLVIAGTYTPAVTGAASLKRGQLPGILIDSINWTNSWLGSVLSNAFVKGAWLPTVEFTSGGFQYGQRQQNDIPVLGGAFRISIALPALNDARGRNVRETSHLAMLFQPSHLKIQWADGANLEAVAPGSTITNLSCRATAILQPRPEVVAATPMEWVLHQTSLAGSATKIPGFGRDSGLVGMQPKGGVSFLGELTAENFQGGIVIPEGVESLQFQWRGLGLLEDVHTWVNQFIGMLPNDRPQQTPSVAQGGGVINDYNGFPFVEQDPPQSADLDLKGLTVFPLAMGGDDMQLTDLQTADTDTTYYLNGAGAFEIEGTGQHQILAQYARQYQGQKLQDFVAAVTAGQQPLAKYVYGDDYVKYQMRPRFPRDKHSVSADQAAYVSFMLAP